jgi:general secretion pathway protein G
LPIAALYGQTQPSAKGRTKRWHAAKAIFCGFQYYADLDRAMGEFLRIMQRERSDLNFWVVWGFFCNFSPRDSVSTKERIRPSFIFPMLLPTHSKLRRAARAFTLLEILIAIAILGLLVGLVVEDLGSTFSKQQENIARLFVQTSIETPLFSYKSDMGSYPSTSDGLQALVAAPANNADNWRGPYLKDGRLPKDPWGQPYQYASPGTHNKNSYDVWSKGPPDKPSDIGNW